MSRKSRRKILLGLMVLVICVAAIFTVKAYLYADARNSISNKEDAERIGELCEAITALPNIVDKTEQQKVKENQTTIKGMELDFEDVYLLAKIAMAEAEGEDTEGKALVIMVVLNRVWSEGFPETIEEVIMEEHSEVHQFSVVQAEGRWWKVEPDANCYEAVEMVMDGWDESQGALYFESKSESTWHQENLDFLFQHGGHYFYKNKE